MILHSDLLSRLDWLEHGFGTRHAELAEHEMASLMQVHSARAVRAGGQPGCAGEGDALYTNRAGAALAVRTADCLPILLADARSRAVAAIHAGWRGTAAGIVSATLQRMRAECGVDPRKVCAAIGPGIGACCYHVGLDVARRFGLDAAGRLDLAAENRRQLLQAGVPRAQLQVFQACTCCDPARFHSWRRDKNACGRMISYIRIVRQAEDP
jgi:hypothetical protein